MGASPFLLVAVCALTASAIPANFLCSRYCKEGTSKFGYDLGHSYIYDYSGSVKSTVNSITSDGGKVGHTELFFRSKVKITAVSPCDYVMQLYDVYSEEIYINKDTKTRVIPNKNQALKDALSKNPLPFSYSNGRIETICADEDDTEVLHIKKAILSVFQNSMPHLKENAVVFETDISGNCETRYNVQQSGLNLVIKKSKNLEACSHRKTRRLSWLPVPYGSSTKNPLLRSTQKCEQIINANLILESSECFEEHLFKPFSSGDNGAVIYLTQNLQYIGSYEEVDVIDVSKNFHYDSLLSQYHNSKYKRYSTNQNIIPLLQILESKTIDGVEPDVPQIFSQLVVELENLDSNTMIAIFESIQVSTRQKKFLVDGMSLISTSDGIEAIKFLYKKGEISHSHMNSWLTSIIFYKNISLPILSAIAPLLDSDKAIKQTATLSASTIIYMYCKQEKQCEHKQEVQQLINLMVAPLKSTCVPRSTDEHNSILLSLKALGNTGSVTSLSYLRNCFTNRNAPMELRLAAITAHRRINCPVNDNLEYFENFFANREENTEIRIATYLAAMQCASYSTFARVKDILRIEETNQVGSFIWTHLTNLQESSTRWKQNLKNLVENEFLRNKFNTDMRKYSRNYELSTFFDSINTGAGIESNVIFTSDSYLPKSVMLNFTLDLFGESVNIFEIGARMEGFEQIVENIFGPEGILSSMQEKEVSSDNKIKQIGDIFSSKSIVKDPSGLLHARIFGNEIAYTNFKNINDFVNGKINSGTISDMVTRFFRQQNIDYTKSVVFIDSSYEIPTMLGFPLRLAVNGTSTFGLTLQGKIDVKNLMSNKINIEGKIYPSAAVEVIGTMMVDCFFSKVGLRSENKLNTNTYIDGHAVINKGRLVDIQINVPKKQMNIINFESQMHLIRGSKYYPIDDLTENVVERDLCTKPTFSKITGLKFCYKLFYVNGSLLESAPHFPLTGKFKYSLDIRKTDIHNSYKLQLKRNMEVKNFRPIYSFEILLDTPLSAIDRKFLLYYLLDLEQLSLNAGVKSPFISLEIDSKIGTNKDNLLFVLQTKLNEDELLLTNMSLKSTKQEDNTWSYVGITTINYKSKQIAALYGNLNYLESSKYNADLKVDSISNYPIKLIGEFQRHTNRLQLVTGIESDSLNGNAQALIVKNSQSISIEATATYNLKNLKEQKIDFQLKTQSTLNESDSNRNFFLKLNSTQSPYYNTLVSISIHQRKLFMESIGSFVIFDNTWETYQLFKYNRDKGNSDIAVSCFLKCIDQDIDYKIDLRHLKLPGSVVVHSLLQLNQVQRIELSINYNMDSRNRILNLFLYYPKQTWSVNGIFTQLNNNDFDISLQGFYNTTLIQKLFMELSGGYKRSSDGHLQIHRVTGLLNFPDSETNLNLPWTVTYSLQTSSDILISSAQLQVKDNFYISSFSWTPSSTSASIYTNEKKIFWISGIKTQDEFSIFCGINIYQHFELTTKLTTAPFDHFKFVFYWNKDIDTGQRVSLVLDRDFANGLYLVNVEYPNQKVGASIVFLPSQVTMNITWGSDLMKRIYLKAGNEVNDIGAVWFVTLDTPFKYMESQKISLSYYCLPESAELKMDAVWSDQQVNFVGSGTKSHSHISGYIEVNTTFTKLAKMVVAASHYYNTTNDFVLTKNDAIFVLNNQELKGQFLWRSRGTNAISNFELVSPTNLISPILGSLTVNNTQTLNRIRTYIEWKQKHIVFDCQVQNTNSYLTVKTPFEGLEIIELNYTIVAKEKKVVMETTVNLLRRYNHALLIWDSNQESNKIKFDITSPIVGSYQITFKHSTLPDVLEEYLIVTQGSDNDIMAIKLQGNILPLSIMDLNVNFKFLEHSASLFIKNDANPLTSIIKAQWKESYVLSNFSVELTDAKISLFSWNVSSSFLNENILVFYNRMNTIHTITITLPNGYKFNNWLRFHSLRSMNNLVSLVTPRRSVSLFYIHYFNSNYLSFKNEIIFKTNNDCSIFFLNYNIDKNYNFLDTAVLKLETPWYNPVVFNFSMPLDILTELNPVLYLEYGNVTTHLNSLISYNYSNSHIQLTASIPEFDLIKLDAKYDFTQEKKIVEAVVSHGNLLVNITGVALFDADNGVMFLNAILNTPQIEIFQSIAKYDLHNSLKGVYFKSSVYKNHYIEVQLSGITENTFQTELQFLSSIPEWEEVNISLNLGLLNSPNNFKFIKNGKAFIIDSLILYSETKSSTLITANGLALSDFESLGNYSIKLDYVATDNSKKIKIMSETGKYENMLEGYYKISYNKTNPISNLLVDSSINVVYETFKHKGNIVGLVSSTLDKLNGHFVTSLNSSISTLGNNSIRAHYNVLKNGYKASGSLTRNREVHKINGYFKRDHEKLDIWCSFRTPIDISKLFSLKKLRFINTNQNSYNVSVFSKNNLPLRTIEFDFITPYSQHKGQLKTITTSKEINTSFNLISDDNIKKSELKFITKDYTNLDFFIYLDFPVFKVNKLQAKAKYDISNLEKIYAFLQVNYAKHIVIKTLYNINKLDAIVKLNSNEQFELLASHKIKSISDIWLTCACSYKGHRINIDVTHTYYTDEINTSFNISSSTRLKNIIYTSKLNNNQLNALFELNEYSVAVTADKNALLNNRNLVEIDYKKNPIIVVWSGNNNSYIKTFLPLADYTLVFDYKKNTGNYELVLFSENVILHSVTLEHIKLNDYYNVTLKMISSLLPKDHSNLNVHLHTNYKTFKALELAIQSESDTLLTLSYNFQKENDLYSAKFQLNTFFEMLQSLIINLNLNTKLTIDFSAEKIQYDIYKQYLFKIVLPMNSTETVFVLRYPLKDEYVSMLFFMKYHLMKFELKTPFQILNTATLTATHEKNNRTFNLRLNEFFVNSNWLYKYDLESLLFKIHIDNQFYNNIGRINANLHYISWDNMKLNMDIDELKTKFDLVHNIDREKLTTHGSLIVPWLLIDDLHFDSEVSYYRYIKTSVRSHEQKLANLAVFYENPRHKTNIDAEFVIMDDFINYKLNHMYNHESRVSSTILDSITSDYILQLTVTSALDLLINNGNVTVIITDGWKNTELINNYYNLMWNTKYDKSNKSGKVSFTQNTHTSYIDLFSISSDSNLKLGIIVSCDGKALDLQTELITNPNSTHAFITLKTPLQDLNLVQLQTSVIHSHSGYKFDNLVKWSNDNEITLLFQVNHTDLYLQVTSPLSKPFTVILYYDKLNDNPLNFKIELGMHSVTLFSFTSPQYFIIATISSPITGNVNITSSFDLLLQIIELQIQKEKFANLGYQSDFDISHNDMNSALKLQMQLDMFNMNGTGEILWKNDSTKIALIYKPSNLLFQIGSPSQHNMFADIQGYYKDNDLHLSGVWNKLPINITMFIMTNSKIKLIESKLIFAQNLIDFKLSSTTDKVHFDLSLPFENFRSISSNLNIDQNYIQSSLYVNFLGDLLETNVKLNRKSGEVITNINLNIPQILTTWELQINQMLYERGTLKIYYKNIEKSIHMTANYQIIDSILTSNYTIENNKGEVIDHNFILCFKSNEFCVIFDKHKILYKNASNIIELEANLPHFEIITNLKVLTQHPNYKITFDSSYKDYSLGTEIQSNNIDVNGTTIYKFGEYSLGTMYTQLQISKDTLLIKNIVLEDDNTQSNNLLLHIDINKRLRTVTAKISDILNFDLKYVQPITLNLILLKSNHFKLKLNQNAAHVYIYSDYLLDNDIDVNVSWLTQSNNLQLSYTCLQQNTTALQGYIQLDHNSELFSLKTETFNNDKSLYFFVDILTKNITQGTLLLEIFNQTHQAYFIISKTDPFTAGLTIGSPFISNNGFTIETGASLNAKSLFIFIGSGYSDALKTGLLELKLHQQYILFETELQKNKLYAKYEAEKIFLINVIELNCELNIQDNMKYFKESFIVKSKDTEYISAVSNFDFPKGLTINIHTNIPMLQSSKFVFNLLIPFQLSQNFRPGIFIELPNGNIYCTEFVYSRAENIFLIMTKYQYKSFKLNTIVHFENQSVFSLLDLPVGRFEVSLKMPQDFEHGNNVYNYIDLQGTKIKLNYQIVYIQSWKLLNVQLETPFKLYEKFGFNVEYQNDNRNKILKGLFIYPFIQNECGFDLSIKYQNLKIFNSSALISLPISVYGFKYGKVLLNHNMNFNEHNKLYSVEGLTQFNNIKVGLDFATVFNSNTKSITFNSYKGNKKIFVNVKSLGSIFEKYDLFIGVETPNPLKSSIEFGVGFTPKIRDGFHSIFRYNYYTFWNVNFAPKNNLLYFYISNIWKPFLIEYKYLYTENLETHAKLCWNLHNPSVLHIQVDLILGNNISFALALPTRIMSVTHNRHISNNNKYNFYEVSWYKDKRVAIMLTNSNFTKNNRQFVKYFTTITLPFKTFEIINELETGLLASNDIKSTVTIKWNTDDISKLLIENHIINGQLYSKISVPALIHDIVIKVDATSISKVPSCMKGQLEYSDDINKKIEVEMYYNRKQSDTYHTERRFVLRHSASKIDYDLRFSTTATPTYTIGNITLFYYNYLLNHQESIRSSLAISHEKFDVTGEIQTSKNYLSLTSLVNTGINYKSLSMTMQINGKEPLILSGIYNFKPKESSVHLSTSIGSSRTYNFFAGFPTKREITAKLTHSLYDSEVVDGLLSLRLNNSQILWLKLNWKNHLVSQFKNFILDEYYDMRYAIEATGQELINTIDDSIGQQLLDDILNTKLVLSAYALKETTNLSKGYEEFLQDIKEGYHENLFYIQDILATTQTFLPTWKDLKMGLMDPIIYFIESLCGQLLTLIDETASTIYDICETIKNNKNLRFTIGDIQNIKLRAKEVLKTGINDARDALKEMDVLAMQLLEKIDQCVLVIKEKCENTFDPYITIMDDFINYLEQRLTILQILFLDMLDTIQYYIINLRESREILKAYFWYVNWLEELHITTLLEPIGDILESILETIIMDTNKVLKDYKPYVNAILEGIFGNYKEINELPPLIELREMCNNFYERTLWIWNYNNLSNIIKSYIHQIISNFDDYFASLMELEEGGNDFENVLGQSNYVFRPDLGIVEITQPLPVEWEAFDEVPHFEQESLYQKIKRRSEHLIQLQRTYFIDLLATFNNYLGKPTTTLLSPSTNNIASIVGKSHYITFDKKYYNFAGQCSYLLASDLIGNSFSVIVNYVFDNSSVIQKSISIINDGNNFEISPEFGVKLNDQQISLPLLHDSITILQENNLILIENLKGLKIVCNLYYDFCTVELSGWLFGRTAGLLGTLDNEKITDMRLPDGDQTSDVLEFVQSWQMKSSKCIPVNHAENSLKISSPFATILFKTLCQVYFVNANSPLGNCFNLVDPAPFYNMCVNSMKAVLNPTICVSIAAYRGHCEKAGIPIKIPEICISCNHGIGQTEDIFDKNNPESIDVVVIKDSCSSANHNVSLFIQNLEQHLTRRHFINNQYAVVGFTSTFGKPFVYTNGKKIWSSANETAMNIDLKLQIHTRILKTPLANNAINYASNLEFRPGVTKMFILMQCEGQYEEANLNHLHKTFGEKDVIFHVLKTQAPGHNGDELIEMDKKGNILYINHGFDVEALKVTVDIKTAEQVTDSYIILALSTNGSVLRIDKYSEAKVDEFAMHWSEIVSQSARRSPCQRCRCVENIDGTGKVECKRCMSPAVKQLLIEYESNLLQFRNNEEANYT